jgi:predicted Zn-dependent protease
VKYLLQRALFGMVTRVAPGAEWAWFHLGNAHAEHGRVEAAIGPWTKACAQTPPRAAAALNLASALLERGAPRDAVDPLERLVSHDPQDARGWALLGKARQKAGDLPGAVEAYERLIALEPANDMARFTAGALLEKTGRREEAAGHYRAVTDPALRPKAEQRLRVLKPAPKSSGG